MERLYRRTHVVLVPHPFTTLTTIRATRHRPLLSAHLIVASQSLPVPLITLSLPPLILQMLVGSLLHHLDASELVCNFHQ